MQKRNDLFLDCFSIFFRIKILLNLIKANFHSYTFEMLEILFNLKTNEND